MSVRCNSTLILIVCLLLAGPSLGAAQPKRIDHEKLDRSIDAGVRFLLSKIEADGSVKGDYGGGKRHGGLSALVAQALLTAGVDPSHEKLSKTIRWVSKAEMTGTYPIALRACMYGMLNDPDTMGPLRRDVNWLIKASGGDGAYSYGSQLNSDSDEYDNSNSQLAVLGVWMGAQRGVEVPISYWRSVEQHWLNQQQPDGGFGYQVLDLPARTKTYGSMTAAGLATLYICFDELRRNDYARCTGSTAYRPAEDATAWLSRNFSVRNPCTNSWDFYWLYCVERVGLAGGVKYFGDNDWFADGVNFLLRTQLSEGNWLYDSAVYQTAFSVMFLARGRNPVLVNKLKYDGRWDNRPRDMANLTRWLSWSFERTLNWQVVEIERPVEQWQDAPILYISGSESVEFSPEQIGRLRTFVLQGGTILSEAACNDKGFTASMKKVYGQMFPDWPLEDLGSDHPIYKVHFDVDEVDGLQGVSNGVRLLAIHSPRELSLALQTNDTERQAPWFKLAANIYFYATDRGSLRPRGMPAWPSAGSKRPVRTIAIARLMHEGNSNPEPLAWERLAIVAARDRGLGLDLSEPMSPAKLDAKRWPVAAMTGTENFELDEDDIKAIKSYIAAGGTLVIDAAGGSRRFDEAVRRELFAGLGSARPATLSSQHPIFLKPHKLALRFRRDLAIRLGSRSDSFELLALQQDDRPVIIYSPHDITAGLAGYEHANIAGYRPESASELMLNILENITSGSTSKPSPAAPANQQ
jgi:hypothetical protein